MGDSRHRILVVDDDTTFLALFLQTAKLEGRAERFEVFTAESGERALARIGKTAPDVIVTDMQMPGMDGIELYHKLSDRYPGLPVVILTAFGSTDQAIEAIKMGAYHYFTKPITDPDLFWRTLDEAAGKKKAADELHNFRMTHNRLGVDTPMVGTSAVWKKIVDAVAEVAPVPTNVLISGETGTGKEIVARTIHRLSPQADRPFVAVSCAEFAGSLLETELFGHERGAFTNALTRRQGIFERAHGGTLFLDEIAETSFELQSKLLRVLQGSPFYRVGGQEPIESDFRLIAATNRNLDKDIAAGHFRSDLYYRLSVYPIHLPPLRERVEDVLPLSLHFLEKTARKFGKPPKTLSGAALTLLVHKEWPGNVRELENLIEWAVIRCRGREITPEDIIPAGSPLSEYSPGISLETMERLLITLALERCGHNKSQASELLGIARKTLKDKMNRYHMPGGPDV